MTHSELCKITATRFIKDNHIVLFEYQSWAHGEFPDVLCFGNGTTLYEIKVRRSDFLVDQKKDCRTKYKHQGFFSKYVGKRETIKWHLNAPVLMHVEAPHLGKTRYYVCPHGLIDPADLPEGWGLYWYKNGRFYLKQKSKLFQRNIHGEMQILTHAMRKMANGYSENILISNYNIGE